MILQGCPQASSKLIENDDMNNDVSEFDPYDTGEINDYETSPTTKDPVACYHILDIQRAKEKSREQILSPCELIVEALKDSYPGGIGIECAEVSCNPGSICYDGRCYILKCE